MALKDWKKFRTEPYGVEYMKRNKYNPSQFDTLWIIEDYPSGYRVNFSGKSKSFKTKSQALKFAREYMMKN